MRRGAGLRDYVTAEGHAVRHRGPWSFRMTGRANARQDHSPRSRGGVQAVAGLPAVVGRPTQIVLRELQTLSGHPDRRPREARERVDAGGDRDGRKVCLKLGLV